jgi:hypothetical protein
MTMMIDWKHDKIFAPTLCIKSESEFSNVTHVLTRSTVEGCLTAALVKVVGPIAKAASREQSYCQQL